MDQRPVSIVTGGSSGIGRATAALLAAAGDRVYAIDRQPRGADEVCRNSGGRSLEGDVSSLASVRAALDTVLGDAGRIDRLVCAAGISIDGMLWRQSEEDFDRTIAVDLKGAWASMRSVAPAMRAARKGAIVCVASTLALHARVGVSAYASAKAGLVGLVRGAARDLGPSGVRVNAVAPGLCATPLGDRIPDDVKARLAAETPLRRIAQPEDVASVIAFLLSDGARHVTGEIVRVDGGQLA